MTPEQYAHVKELFFQARELSEPERDEFLRRECKHDAAIYDEVTSLIRYDSKETVLVLNPQAKPIDFLPRFAPRERRVLSRIERVSVRMLHELFGSRTRRLLVVVGVVLGLLALAYWSHSGMKRSTKSIAGAELTTIRDADVTALKLWIEEKKKDVRLFSSQPEIRRAVQELVRIAETASEPSEALRSSQALDGLHKILARYDRIAGRPEQDGVINRDGLVLAAAHDDAIGDRLNNEGRSLLLRVFQGDTIFVRPSPDGAFSEQKLVDIDTPVVFVIAPIGSEDNENEIIAAAAFGFPADGEFSNILRVARKGTSGETFAFDQNGLLLNESRFDLKEIGLLPDEPNVRSSLRIEIRDPGQPPYNSALSSIQRAAQPLTPIAAQAIAASRKGGPDEQHDVVLDPYRNYRGATVIGAWTWLPEYSMGVATEVEVDEQYAPMRYPLIAERIRLGMLAGSVLLLLAAASWIVILDRDLTQAKKLGQYVLENEIGRGGMGVVYQAKHALLQRPTAIKLLRPESVTESSLARFEREVQLASGLTHPNTIEIFDFGRTPDDSFYCVMELLHGQTLAEIIRDQGPLPAQRAVHVLAQIAGSLAEAHRKGVVHRDIKPTNVMLCEIGGIDDVVKVLDFGLARTVKGSDGERITQAGLILGTPPYLAPESITDPMMVDPQSDLYSLGAVAYYLLTGHEVYEGTSVANLIYQTINDSPCLPHERTNSQIPADLETLVMACLAKQPEQRPANIQAVIDELARISKRLDQATPEIVS